MIIESKKMLQNPDMLKVLPAYVYESPEGRDCMIKALQKFSEDGAEGLTSMIYISSMMREFSTEDFAQIASYSAQKKLHTQPDLQTRYRNLINNEMKPETVEKNKKAVEWVLQSTMKRHESKIKYCAQLALKNLGANKSN